MLEVTQANGPPRERRTARPDAVTLDI